MHLEGRDGRAHAAQGQPQASADAGEARQDHRVHRLDGPLPSGGELLTLPLHHTPNPNPHPNPNQASSKVEALVAVHAETQAAINELKAYYAEDAKTEPEDVFGILHNSNPTPNPDPNPNPNPIALTWSGP